MRFMANDTAWLAEIADGLRTAEAEAVTIPPLTETMPTLTLEDAYAVQLRNVSARIHAGAQVRGHKIGLTARAMQELLGVDEPDYGHLFDDMFVTESDSIRSERLCAPRAEPEVAFVLAEPLAGPGVTAADVLGATRFLLPSLEIIDSRIADWRIGLPDTVADNASAARVVLGARPTPVDAADLRTLGSVVWRDGEVVATGATGAVLGNPVDAVAWLANKLAEYDTRLEAGHVVLTGSCTTAVPVSAGTMIRAEFDVLGAVTARFR